MSMAARILLDEIRWREAEASAGLALMGEAHCKQEHYLTVEDCRNRAGREMCRAFCRTCYWRGPMVRFRGTAERHAVKHAKQTAGDRHA